MPEVRLEASIEAHKFSQPFGDGSGQIVIPALLSDAAKRPEGMIMAADEVLKLLGPRELDVKFSGVAKNHDERMDFHSISEYLPELAPIHLSCFPGFKREL